MKLVKVNKYFIVRYITILCIGFSLLCSSKKSVAQATKSVPVVVEIIQPAGTKFNIEPFADMKDYTTDAVDVKQWKDRVVVYVHTANPAELRDRIAVDHPGAKVILFEKPFYNFNRKYCNNTHTAKQWDNIILSANLVADPKLQKEYLEYHRTQFEKWPEVSKGFCNANFQQLLVFRNGRQLMLIISIPKGESLDKLNPLTTKNNPRVNDWNKIMAKYQEGIPGTKKGEVWVFFKTIKDPFNR